MDIGSKKPSCFLPVTRVYVRDFGVLYPQLDGLVCVRVLFRAYVCVCAWLRAFVYLYVCDVCIHTCYIHYI